MGVPAFFRWLTRKYPSVIVDCVEQGPREVDGVKIYSDSSEPNPNNVEFDNLYLDMNGIIHPCTHPENKPAPKNEDEMMIAIFECIDRLFNIVRPRKVLYMAIDGVAPRAKMNQQRSRRFRASKETYEKIEEIARIREDLRAKGVELPPEKPKGEHFDSNCITPGTPFMARLSTCLHYYIHDRLNNDPGWKGIKVILSDANVPGEGEHKIMDYIRKQRAQPDHDPNTQHCLCGADADLIMLGLATHEPNFTIIREEFKPNQPRPCEICGQVGHELKDCMGVARSEEDVIPFTGSEVNFIFVRLCVLREYLEKELNMPNLPFPFDLERAIDDWVFMCFFVGNDFLPHLPSLEIREGAIDRLVRLYKDAVYKTGGYLTDSGDVNLDRVQLIMSQLGEAEDNIFKERQSKEKYFREKNKKNKMREKMMRDFGRSARGQFAPQPLGRGAEVRPVQNARQEAYQMRMFGVNPQDGMQAMLRPEGQAADPNKKEDSDSDEEPPDEVRLWEDGFKDRYYSSKFDCGEGNIDFRYKLAHEYVRGLCWVLQYYYQGCASWKWYFPYHYAPFASDFINIGSLSTKFEKGTKPFRPLEQLMGVFPAASSSHVPEPWAKLMSDPDSLIVDFYPQDFKIDLNGKKFAWQGVALLPFVNEQRLFEALEPYYKFLTPAEIRRNVRGDDRLYISKHHPEFSFINTLYESKADLEQEFERSMEGVRGRLLLSEDRVPLGETIDSPVKGLDDLKHNSTVCIRFRDPKYDDNFIFPAKKLPNAVMPPRILRPEDFNNMNSRGRGNGRGNWRPQIGMAPARQRVSLDVGGHRMLNAGVGGLQNFGGGPVPLLNQIPATLAPPPMQMYANQREGYSTGRPQQDGYSTGNRRSDGYSTGQRSDGYSTGQRNDHHRSNSWNSGGQGGGYRSSGGGNWREQGSRSSHGGHQDSSGGGSGGGGHYSQPRRFAPYDTSRHGQGDHGDRGGRGGSRYRGNSRGGRGGGGGDNSRWN